MATLQTIRNRGGLLVSIVIGLALVAFIVGDALSSGSRLLSGSRNEVGEIAGESISIMDYQNRLAKNEEMYKMNGMTSLSEEQQTMLRENTWQQIAMEIIMNNEYNELGIDVSGDELYDMLLGENMNPTVRQMFADQNGNVDLVRARTIIKSILDAPADAPQAASQKAFWLNMEEQIASARKQMKYSTLLTKGLFTTDAEAENNVRNSAAKTDISYIVKSYATISDSAVSVSADEIKEFYNSNKKLFEQPESRNVVYVNFDIEASPEDYKETENWVTSMTEEFAKTDNVSEFVDLSSDVKFDGSYYTQEEIGNDSLANFLFSDASGVFGPYLESNAYKIAKAASVKMLPDSVRARHILITPQNNDYAQAKALADSLAGLLKKGGDFEALAKQYSNDQNSAVNGGDLGWFGPKMMIQPFSDTVFFASKNAVKVVLTQAGAHIVQVTDMAKPVKKVQVATVQKGVEASQNTINKVYNDARVFAANIKTEEDFNKKVTETGLSKRMATVNKNDKGIAGMDNARDLVRQIYLSKEPGEAVLTTEGSNIFEAGNKFSIAVLTQINEEGIAPVNNVAANIKRDLIQKKKAGILKKELETAMSGSESLLSIAQKAGLEVKEAVDISFNSFQIPGAGIEPKVIATATLLEQGKPSAAIEGNQGVYILMVNNRVVDEITPDMQEQIKLSMQQSGMYRANYQAMQALMKNANVKDQRYKFY